MAFSYKTFPFEEILLSAELGEKRFYFEKVSSRGMTYAAKELVYSKDIPSYERDSVHTANFKETLKSDSKKKDEFTAVGKF